MDGPKQLLDLAKHKFEGLQPAEEIVLRAVAEGNMADCACGNEEEDDPANSARWGSDRVVRAKVISWVATDGSAQHLVSPRGVWGRGFRVDGELELAPCDIPFPILLIGCAIPGGISLQSAHTRLLALPGCRTGHIGADGMRVDGALLLREGFTAEGGISLVGATVSGQVNLSGARLMASSQRPRSLSADGLRVDGGLLLREGLVAVGEISLVNARIGGDLSCRGALIVDPLAGSDVDLLIKTGGLPLGDELMRHVDELRVGRGDNDDQEHAAIVADGIKVDGSINLNHGFHSIGCVQLIDARVGGQLACMRGTFSNSRGTALAADGLRTSGTVFLSDEFAAYGEVRFLGAHIGGALNCDGGQFHNPHGDALCAESTVIDGSIFLRNGFGAVGRVNMVHGTGRCGLACWGLSNASEVEFDLRHCTIRTLWDEEASWPAEGKLLLNGFRYDDIDEHAPRTVQARLRWLRRQRLDEFSPQPYEQLASVYRRGGREEDAKRIQVEKSRDFARQRRRYGPALKWSQQFWYRGLGPLIGYGYHPFGALRLMLLFLAFGWLFFGMGFRAGVMVPKTDLPPKPSAVMYSVDVFVPVVSLDEAKHWSPDPDQGRSLFGLLHTGDLLRAYMWIEIAAGWVLISLFVVALTGVIKS